MYTTDLLVSFLYVQNQEMIRVWVVNNYWTLYIKKFKECLEVESYTHPWPFSKSKFNLKSDRVNLVAPAMSYLVSALFTRCPGDTVQTGTGKVDSARKFKYTTAACAYNRNIGILSYCDKRYFKWQKS